MDPTIPVYSLVVYSKTLSQPSYVNLVFKYVMKLKNTNAAASLLSQEVLCSMYLDFKIPSFF